MNRLTDTVLKQAQIMPRRYDLRDSVTRGFCAVVYPSGAISFVLRFRTHEGRSRTYTLGSWPTLNVAQARRAAQSKAAEVSLGTDVQDAKIHARKERERRKSQTLRTFFEQRYQAFCESTMKTGKHQAWLIDKHFVKAWGDRAMDSITPVDALQWRHLQRARGLKPGGVNRPISALKAMLNRAVEWGVIDKNPLASFKPEPEDHSPINRFLSDDEETRLMAELDRRQASIRNRRRSANQWRNERGKLLLEDLDSIALVDHLKPIVLLALHTGLRKGEIFNLRWEDVDLERALVRIDGKTAKTRRTRHVPLNEIALKTLKEWAEAMGSEPGRHVFSGREDGSRLDNIATSWVAVRDRARLQDFRFHDLRHTFCSRLAMKGVDLYTVATLAGHQSIETTQRYAHLAPSTLAEAVSRIV